MSTDRESELRGKLNHWGAGWRERLAAGLELKSLAGPRWTEEDQRVLSVCQRNATDLDSLGDLEIPEMTDEEADEFERQQQEALKAALAAGAMKHVD